MQWNRWAWGMLAVCGVAIVGAIVWFNSRRSSDEDPIVVSSNDSRPSDSPSHGWSRVGGITRPDSDVQINPRLEDHAAPPLVPHGFQPGVAVDLNPQVAGVYEALKDRTQPSRFSSFATPMPFDREAYQANPQDYLNMIEPARVFGPAQPGDGVPVLRTDGTLYHRVVQGEAVRLQANVPSGMPLTFNSFSLGTFDSGLSSTTVASNDRGVAEAVFLAGPGTVGDIEILAAGPMTSGQLRYLIQVVLPVSATDR